MTWTVASSWVCTSPLAVMTIVELHTTLSKYPFQQNSSPSCWSYASTRRSRQQMFFPQVQDLFSEGEKKAALFFSFIFMMLLASFHAASRAHRSCHSVSSWDRSSIFEALGLRWWGSPGQIYPSDGFWSLMSAWRATAFVNVTVLSWFPFLFVFGVSLAWVSSSSCPDLSSTELDTGHF